MSRATRELLGSEYSVSHYIRTEDRRDYNCGGYALETFDWVYPYVEGLRRRWKHGTDLRSVMRYARYLTETIPGVRIIEQEREMKDNEYLVAFRTSNYDFHFCKRDDSGNWRHKRGRCEILFRILKSQVFSPSWDGGYDSPIILLAVEK